MRERDARYRAGHSVFGQGMGSFNSASTLVLGKALYPAA